MERRLRLLEFALFIELIRLKMTMLTQRKVSIVALILSIVLSIQLTLKGFNSIGIISSFDRVTNNRLMSLEFFILSVLYLVWLNRSRADKTASNYTQILGSATPFLIFSWLAYPITKDLYLYLQYGLMSLNRVNPYLTKASDFQSDLSNLLDWSQSSTYGLVSLFFFIISARLSEIHLVLGVYGFKLICLVFHVLNGYLIWRILKQDSRRTRVTFAYLLSPALLFEQVTNAHVDVFLCTVLIAIDQFLKYRKYLSALVVTGVGFLTKTLPIIWLPLIGVFLIRQKRWKILVQFLLICAIAILILSLTAFPSIEAWRSVLNPGVGGKTAGSWHNLLGAVLLHTKSIVPSAAQEVIPILFNRITLLLFAVYYGIALVKIYRQQTISESQLMIQIGWVTFVLFAFATPWYQPWYATILLPIAALNLEARFFAIASFIFSLVSTTAYFCLAFDQTKAGILGSFLTMGSVILLFLIRPKLTETSPKI